MKRILFMFITVFVILGSLHFLYAEDKSDPGLRPPIEAAKEYVAKKYNCDINGLTVGDTLIGRSGANIDINHSYGTERVALKYNYVEQRWVAEDSESLHQY